jgi:internalin A
LKHLQRLNLGGSYRDAQGRWQRSLSEIGEKNSVGNDLGRLGELNDLRSISLSDVVISDLSGLMSVADIAEIDCSDTQVSDLTPLAGLSNLQTLSCDNTQVSDLAPLARLSNLQTLHCYNTQVSDLATLARLSNLQTLHCYDTQVRDLAPLAGLPNLQTLYCYDTQVRDLAPLAGLPNLQTLYCYDTQVRDLAPLAGLSNLQSLYCSSTKVSDLAPLTGLSNLQSLSCSDTQVRDLAPLAALSNLRSLYCHNTQVSDLAPLAGLSNLRMLYCYNTQVSDLAPLAGLSNLRALDCSDTQVSDFAPLAGLSNLQTLYCLECRLVATPPAFWRSIHKIELVLYDTIIPHVPVGVLSQGPRDDCFESLRAHLKDIDPGSEEADDVKLMVLGNGRIGKTQICRRLRHEDFDETVASTHGVLVTSAPLTRSDNAASLQLQIWDFGGQDIYHGTHTLFLRSRAIFLLVWIPETENSNEYRHDAIAFRNQPLPYWVEYVRQFGGTGSPLVIVQTRCDRTEDELAVPPVSTESLATFPFRKLLHYSAKQDRGRAALAEALQQAVIWLKERQRVSEIGIGRAQVKRRLEEMRDADAAGPPEARQYRTIAREHFRLLCEQAGGVSDPDQLLAYLHNTGTVFYRSGLFDDRIVLDQGWALESIYAVFHREKCVRRLQRQKGRFTRSDLADWLWDELRHSTEEQELFLTMMQSCGICFCVRPGSNGAEAEYIAPDFLPERDEVELELSQKWDGETPTETTEFDYPMLLPGLMRGIISSIGKEAGLNADYWRGGVYVFESGARSRAVIEQQMTDGWAGRIRIQTQRGQAALLLARLTKLVEKEQTQAGIEPLESPKRRYVLSAETGKFILSGREAEAAVIAGAFEQAEREASRRLKFVQEDASTPEYFVSYAWGDATPEGKEREAIVDRLCAEATAQGVTIIRDKTAMTTGDRISKFMLRLGRANRIFVVLSDKYLKSPFCMFELFEVWRNCRSEDEEFLRRIRVFTAPTTKIWTPLDRTLYAVHWRQEFGKLDALVKEHGIDILGEKDAHQHRLMKKFANEIGDILATVADILQPRDFDEFAKYGFSDRPPDAP